MSVALVATEGTAKACSQDLHLGSFAATWHSDIWARAAAKDRVWVCDPTTVGVCVNVQCHVVTKGHTDAQGLDHNLRFCWCRGLCQQPATPI